ncbi:hypothetical protein MELA_02292 [Candidatus Methylomirabilis lanthanidiphila]|uniref:Uncharacterized protein n=1 Tax=Candidatus Methylomirabilis lanthanidiphila TaxID=2211376 RepID=A0A564ZKP9_9BACT|nr:hypothetical protein [Candidatus Methylomirabilis lanthanidiphila]VUZ85905.1 hypothetical protein MELA_02292 [Candidatus Methylomirabilis lanthanidiphila]
MSEMNGLVDSATVAQVVQCLDRGTTGQYPWSLTTVLDLTAILIRESSMALAPGLGPPKGVALDGQDLLIDLMLSSGLLRSTRQFDQSTRDVAIKRSKRWIARTENSDKVRAEVDRLLADKRDFQPWIDWSSEKAWLSHSRRLGGLFDPNYLPSIAKLVGISEQNASELHRRSTEPEAIKRLVKQRDRDFDIMVRAYVASTIIRGRYHEEVARESGLQITRHPLRGIISGTRTGRASLAPRRRGASRVCYFTARPTRAA